MHVSFHPVTSLARAPASTPNGCVKRSRAFRAFQRFPDPETHPTTTPTTRRRRRHRLRTTPNERIRFRIIHRRHPSSPIVVLGAPRTRTPSATDPPARNREPPIAHRAVRPPRPRTRRAVPPHASDRNIRKTPRCPRASSSSSFASRRVVVRTYPSFLHKTCVVERRSRRARARG